MPAWKRGSDDQENIPVVPIAHPVHEDAEDIPVVVGERVGAPIQARAIPTADVTSATSPEPLVRSLSSSSTLIIEKTGNFNLPGCGQATGTGGTRFIETGSMPIPSAGVQTTGEHIHGGVSVVGDGEYVANGGPMLVACGQGQSMYDVKGCLSSWVLVGGSNSRELRAEGNLMGKSGRGEGGWGGEYGGSGGGGNSSDKPCHAGRPGVGSDSWALRSNCTAAGDGGVMCCACVPFEGWNKSLGPRMFITGGKDSVLREWEMVEGRPSLSAEIAGHTDWISCCSLIPSTSSGLPPTVAVSGGRDGSLRIWSKSAAHVNYPTGATKRNSSRYGKEYSTRGGGGSKGFGVVGTGGWLLASSLSNAHGSSEFVTCSACPSGKSSAAAGWVATGGSDWTVRLWDVAKALELGRLSFRGHSRHVTSLAASADGNVLVSGGEDNKAVVWSPKSRRAVATLQGHESTVNGVLVDQGTGSGHTPRWVATGGGEGFLFIWDPRNWRSPVATLLGEPSHGASTAAGGLAGLSLGGGGHLLAGAEARFRGESGRWEGDTTGATMLKSVNCLSAGRTGDGVEWLFGAGETTIRAWRTMDGMWHGGDALPGGDMRGVASMSVLE